MRPSIFAIMMIPLPGCLQLPPEAGESIQKTTLNAFARSHRIEAYRKQGKSLGEAERLAERDEMGGK